MTRKSNESVGFIVAPLAPALLMFAYVALYSPSDSSGFLAAFFGLIVAYTVTAIIGVPTYFLLRSLRLNSWATYVVGGAIMGIGTFLLLAPEPWTAAIIANDFSRREPHSFMLICAGAGLVAALVFWLIVRPDRQGDDPGNS